jgi:hypothetical protein
MSKRASHLRVRLLHKVWVKSVCALMLVLFLGSQLVNAKPIVFEKNTTSAAKVSNSIFDLLFGKVFSTHSVPMEPITDSGDEPMSDKSESIDDDEFEKFREAHSVKFELLLFEQLSAIVTHGALALENPQQIPLFVLHHSWKGFIA